ncbi:MAG TPA: PQQ-dependent sugar dehydrogenase [Verrucomicrobiae bacterium]|nr:PQQ-dependent sugar dehydrogenase [Verrucomicrobiae bacterium]
MKRNPSLRLFKRLTMPIRWLASVVLICWAVCNLSAQSNDPVLVDAKLRVTTVVSNLTIPTTMAFLQRNDFFVLEKASGLVRRVRFGTNGPVVSSVLDLPVNSASERGLLGIALHPAFPRDPGVYLYWSQSASGMDSTDLADVPLLGNRVDRFRWDGSTLSFETNIIQLRALQMDDGQPLRGNHDGGVIRFGPDGKLYIYIGDVGRRGQMQNLPDGPSAAGNLPDDQFGGPEPDNAHLTGVILRLNDDGTIPRDNPFFRAGALRGGEAGTNIQKVFAYGIRNGFGMAFDPVGGQLWEAQNGDDTFTEINQVKAGVNLGWVQVMGPLSRIAEFKAIETSSNFFGLQQIRWSPTNIADSAAEALARMFWIFEGGNAFAARLSGRQEVPPVETDGRAIARLVLNRDGSLSYELRATAAIEDVTQAHIHLGARGQNGPVVTFLFGLTSPTDFEAGDVIASGRLRDSNVLAVANFTPSISNLVARMRQGRAYVNVHTVLHQGGEIRGQLVVTDRNPVSRYRDPEFSWKYEVAPAALGFINTTSLGGNYMGDMLVGAARDTLMGGTLFHFNLRWAKPGDVKHHIDQDDGEDHRDGRRDDDDDDDDEDDNDNRQGRGHDDDDDDDDDNGHDDRGKKQSRTLTFTDPRLKDRVADNLGKFEITESESLLFGTNFGVVTDIQTGPDGTLYLVSLSHGKVYRIQRR